MPKRYVCIRIPKTGTTWLDLVIRRLEALAMERAGSRTPFELTSLGVPHIFGLHFSLPAPLWCRYVALVRAVEWRLDAWTRRAAPGFREPSRRFMSAMTGAMDKHVPWVQLPMWMREFPVVAVLRDVLSWHLSRWLYITSFPAAYAHLQTSGLYRDGEFSARGPRRQRFVEERLNGELSQSSWENLSAEAYWEFTRDLSVPDTLISLPGSRQHPDIGFCTVRILLLIHRDPPSVFRLSEAELEEYFESGRWRGDICPGWFLRQERLEEDMYRVLVGEIGYCREDLERVLAELPERLNAAEPARKERARRELYGNEALCAEILHAERFAHRYLLPGLTGCTPAPTPGT